MYFWNLFIKMSVIKLLRKWCLYNGKSKVCKITDSPSHKQTHTMNMSAHMHAQQKQAYVHLHNRQTRIVSDRKKQICTSQGNNPILPVSTCTWNCCTDLGSTDTTSTTLPNSGT